MYIRDRYFKSQQEMARLFADAPQALANSIEIARRCNLPIPLGKSSLPDFPVPKGVTVDEYLREQAHAGLKKRGLNNVERLEFELKTIIQMGFAGYFLIVADFINWAKQNGVPVGPGRGSGAGLSLIHISEPTRLLSISYAVFCLK